ncbi:MAG TPA: FAD-dependent oxidoreductase [Chloroflexota bacterium]
MPLPDVVVIGGGIMGCALAWRLAREGARVRLLERGRIGEEASWAAGGQLVPLASPTLPRPLLDHYVAGLRLYGDFVAALREDCGMPFEYRISGRLIVASSDEELAALGEVEARQGPAGVRAELWSAERLAAEEPGVSGLGALHLPEHGYVDNRRMVPALALAAARRGAIVEESRLVSGLLTERGRVVGVEVGGERIEAGAVVNAAGCWAGLVDRRYPVPVAPSKGHMLALDVPAPPSQRIISFPEVTIVPRLDGRLLVASTRELIGYDKRVTAWAVHRLLDGVVRRFPGLAQATLLESWTGLRPLTSADELPLIGAAETPGLYYLTGHHGMGITSAPAAAEALTGLILRRRSPLPIEPFAPTRFADAPLLSS